MSVTVSAARQLDLLTRVLRGLGATEVESSIQAAVLTDADLRGVHSHGLQRLPVLVERIRRGLLKVAVEPERSWTADAVLSIDGRNGLGTAIVETSLRELGATARKHGVAVLAVRNTSHLGMLGYYCERRAEGWCIEFSTSFSRRAIFHLPPSSRSVASWRRPPS